MCAEVVSFDPRGQNMQSAPLPLPNSIEIEQSFLGALLMNNEVFGQVSDFLKPEHFFQELHLRIFDACAHLVSAGKVANPITLGPIFGDLDLGGINIRQYLARLVAEGGLPLNARDYARTITDLAIRRQLIALSETLAENARDMPINAVPADVAAQAITDIQAITQVSHTQTSKKAGDWASDLMMRVDEINSGEYVSEAVTTGYADLDEATNAYEPQTLWVVAGRPGMGKTVFMNASARRTAQKGAGVLEFPLEVGPRQLTARHLADISYRRSRQVHFRDIGRRKLDEDDTWALKDAENRLEELPIEIDDRSRLTVAQLASKVRQTKTSMSRKGIRLGVVFIDHLDFINATDRYAGNRTQEIGEICIALKELARVENLCIVLFCQLNRLVEQRGIKDRRPTLSDLRNSGDIEQVADVVMFAYREYYYLSHTAEYLAGDITARDIAEASKYKFEAVLAKVRAGPTPTIHLWCDVASSTISNMAIGER
jgi:replicative DNA helicase